MKKSILIILIFCPFLIVNAAVFTVCNLPNGGAQYSQIDPAIAAAANGDTIYVMGSSVTYSNCTINKKIKLIGPGTYAQKDNAWPATVGTIAFGNNLNGVAVLGFKCGIYAEDDLQNIEIGYNYISSNSNPFFFFNSNNVSNLHIYSNIIIGGTGIYFSNISAFNNINIENNIFSAPILDLIATNVMINHNVFYNSTYYGDDVFSNLSNAIINNNIFYNADPVTGTSSCTYNNNITYSAITTYPTLPVGNGNINNTDPMMVNVANSGSYLPGLNFSLQSGSPAVNAANDATNIGITGGSNINTVTGEVFNMPVIRQMNIQNTSVPQNGNVNVKVRSTKSRVN